MYKVGKFKWNKSTIRGRFPFQFVIESNERNGTKKNQRERNKNIHMQYTKQESFIQLLLSFRWKCSLSL